VGDRGMITSGTVMVTDESNKSSICCNARHENYKRACFLCRSCYRL